MYNILNFHLNFFLRCKFICTLRRLCCKSIWNKICAKSFIITIWTTQLLNQDVPVCLLNGFLIYYSIIAQLYPHTGNNYYLIFSSVAVNIHGVIRPKLIAFFVRKAPYVKNVNATFAKQNDFFFSLLFWWRKKVYLQSRAPFLYKTCILKQVRGECVIHLRCYQRLCIINSRTYWCPTYRWSILNKQKNNF